MHGVKRGTKTEKEKKEEREKCQNYQSITSQLIQKKVAGELDLKAFRLTSEILNINSEYYTAWNIRRLYIMSIYEQDNSVQDQTEKEGNEKEKKEEEKEEEKEKKEEKEKTEEEKKEEEKTDAKKEEEEEKAGKKLLNQELRYTASLIRYSPKSYWLWFHREWVTDKLDQWYNACDWKEEKNLCTMFLKADSRNFHCWNYRRYVTRRGGVTDSEEFGYTSKKILENFSNYSAWHQRTALLTRMWEKDPSSIQDRLEKEFEFVKNAFYTDALDQSPWLYYRWLISKVEDPDILQRELETCEELQSEEMELSKSEMKWPALTAAHLRKKIGGEATSSLSEIANQLVEADPFRTQYYKECFSSN